MAKKITGYIKLQVSAGKANPAPPIGTALGPQGVNIMEFCKQFNAKTANMGDIKIPVVITVFADRSFTFITKTPPAADLLKKAAKIEKGSGKPNREKVGTITRARRGCLLDRPLISIWPRGGRAAGRRARAASAARGVAA